MQKFLVVNTSGTPEQREQEVSGDPLADMWGRCVATYLGADAVLKQVDRHVLASVNEADAAQRRRWLDQIGEASTRLTRSLN